MMNGIYTACTMVCRLSDTDVRQLKRLKDKLERMKLPRAKKTIHFSWLPNIKCSYGITCHKVQEMKRESVRLEIALDEMLSSYIENGNKEDLGEILRLMQGHFPLAYHHLQREMARK